MKKKTATLLTVGIIGIAAITVVSIFNHKSKPGLDAELERKRNNIELLIKTQHDPKEKFDSLLLRLSELDRTPDQIEEILGNLHQIDTMESSIEYLEEVIRRYQRRKR